MLRNYLKTALRTLRRHKGYTALNIAGLAVGIACCLLIGRWVQFELSYDDFHPAADRTYRVIEFTDDGWENRLGGAMAPLLSERVPAVEATARLTRDGQAVLSRANSSGAGPPKRFEEPNFFFADPTFFDVFGGFKLAKGQPDAVLSRPGSVVLTAEMAQKYFGAEDPVGQTLTLRANVYGNRAERPLTVTGVLEAVPENTHLRFDFLTPMATLKQIIGFPTEAQFSSFLWPNAWTYVRLAEGASAEGVSEQLPALVDESGGTPAEAPHYDARLQPLTSIHLQDLPGEIQSAGSYTYVYVFSAIALFILLLACVNFINLTTARSALRAKEVGVRKVAGAHRMQLARQFLGESVLLTLLALAAGVLLAELLLPVFNAVAGRSLTLGYATNGALWIGLAGIALFVGLIAGSYPALVLSRFRPAHVLGGGGVRAGGGARLRKGLVVFQFTVSIALIAGTLVAHQQFDFMQNARLGFDDERVVTMPAGDDYEALKAEVRRRPGVRAVTGADVRPGFGSIDDKKFETAPFASTPDALADRPTMIRQEVDYGFFEVMDLKMVAGRALSENFSDEGQRQEADSTQYFDFAAPVRGRGFVVNESAAERLGWTPEEAVGKKLRFFATDEGRFYFDVGGSIVGVVEDYHAASLREEIKPMAFSLGGYDRLLVKMAPGGAEDAAGTLRAAWEAVHPQLPFAVSFLDQDLDALYRSEQQLSRVIGLFALLAVGVACLGLFGLAAFAAERRRKEIAIRRTFGASARQVVGLLSKDFLKLVGLAFVFAVPLAWIGAHRWLEGFAYRTRLGPLLFLAAGAAALLVALVATGGQALRAARTNPAQALRDE